MYSLHRAYEVLDIQGWAKSAFSFRKNAFRQKASLENVTLGWKKTFIGEISQTPLKLKAPRAKLFASARVTNYRVSCLKNIFENCFLLWRVQLLRVVINFHLE